MNTKHKLYLILLVIIGIVIMALLNFDQSNYLSTLMARVVQKLASLTGDSHYSVTQINYVVRKFGHLAEYLFLMVICYSFLHGHLDNEFYVFILSFLVVGGLAAFDEAVIQNLIASGRNGQSYDFIIDLFGAVLGYTNIKLYQFLRFNKK